MPKQIISDVIEGVEGIAKQTGKQLGKLPGELVEEAARETGVKPKTQEQKEKEAEIKRMEEEDKKKKGKEIAFFKRQVEEFKEAALAPQVSPQAPKEELKELTPPGERKRKELPPPVLAAKRSGKMGSAEFGKHPGG